jgi:hypothetical protein
LYPDDEDVQPVWVVQTIRLDRCERQPPTKLASCSSISSLALNTTSRLCY